jgi:short-subunit dehydrogenase
MARELGRQKNLIIVARRVERLEALKEEIELANGVKVITMACDLSKIEDVNDFYNATKTYDIDLWINNAGLGDYSYSWETDIEKAQMMANVNMNALMTLSLNYVKDYADVGGTLLNVSSGGGYFVFNKAVTYCASKFFVSAFTEGVAQNLIASDKKMKAKILAPGGTKTEFVQHSEAKASFKGSDIFDEASFMTPETLASHVMALVDSDYVLGMVDENNEFILRNPIFPYGG